MTEQTPRVQLQVGWWAGVFLLPTDITYRPCCSWLEGMLRAAAFRGGSYGAKLLSPAWFLCGEDSIKVKWEVRQTASVFLLRERPAQYFFFFPKAKHFFQFINFINWRIIVLQCCIGFCHTSTTESAIGIHEPSLLNLPPTPYPIPSLSVVTDTGFIFLCHTANSHWPSILPMGMYIFQCSSLNLSHPPLPSHSVHKSVFYTCISIAALQKGLSVPFF